MAPDNIDNFLQAIRKPKTEYSPERAEREMMDLIRSYKNLTPAQLKTGAAAASAAIIAHVDILLKMLEGEFNRLKQLQAELKAMRGNEPRELRSCKEKIDRDSALHVPVKPSVHDLFVMKIMQRWGLEEQIDKLGIPPMMETLEQDEDADEDMPD